MTPRAIRNDQTALRCRRLGDIGEELAEHLLVTNGFTNVLNLNKSRMHYAFADFYAERDGRKFVISVKARNKYEFGSGKLNSRYKLGAKCHEHAKHAERQFDSAVAAWLVISLEAKTFSAFFGLLECLNGSTGVLMTDNATAKYKCLARDEEHRYIYNGLKNEYLTIEKFASLP
jgi:hypothetical protein